MKRIRFFITSLGGGGAEKVLLELLNCLPPDQYEITLRTIFGGVNDAAVPEYVDYRPMCRGGLASKILQKLPQKLFAALSLRGDYDYEVAYLEGRPTRFLAAKKTKGKKYAFVHCDLSVNNIIRPLYSGRAECLDEYRGFDAVCFVSDSVKKGFEGTVGRLDNELVVHNVLDIKRIRLAAEQPCERIFNSDGMKIISMGRLSEEKNYAMLLDIAAELEKEFDFELVILGEGKERNKLEDKILKKNIKSVKLVGFRENPYPYLKQADLFVCSSIFEGYSTAVSEAVALGVPVVTTDCSGMREILGDGRYGTITENSYDGLAGALRSVLDKTKRLPRIPADADVDFIERSLKENEALFQ